MPKLNTVIFPVAGLGTRMLPATKAVPKELLPVYDTPLLQFAINEAIAAGAKRIVLVSHPEKAAIEAYLKPDLALEAKLAEDGKDALLAELQAAALPEGVELKVVYQDQPLGLGHAVLCAAPEVLDGPVGVVLPDDLMLGSPCLADMADAFDPSTMTSLVAAEHVPLTDVSKYGIFDCADVAPQPGQTGAARGLVEKPDPADAPSRLGVVGRYILSAEIFDELRGTGAGAGGEIQLTDAIAALGGIHAFRFAGDRFDCGNKDGIVEATLAVQAMAHRPHLRLAAE